MGAQIAGCRPNCASTKIQCTCDDEVGRTKTNSLDLSESLRNSFPPGVNNTRTLLEATSYNKYPPQCAGNPLTDVT